MRTCLVVSLLALLASCGPADAEDPCGLGVELPSLDDGQARYTQDGQVHDLSSGGYKLGFPHDLVLASLTLNLKQDRDDQRVEDLVAADSFPICVSLDAADDGRGYALLEDGGSSFSTTVDHTGTLALLALEGDLLVGRFAFDARENSGSRVTHVEDGAFRLPPR